MGIAAYNRGTAALRHSIDAAARPVEFEIMERLNALEKYPDAGTPLRGLRFAFDDVHHVWWALDPIKGFAGFGFWYPSLSEAVRRWRVNVVAFDNGAWTAERARLTEERK